MTTLKTVATSNRQIAVRDEGQGDVLLFAHGFPLDHSMWDAHVEHFSKTHRCLAVDLTGFGKSEVAPGTLTMGEIADDLALVLTTLQITTPVTLCGLSMGGYVAWQFWKRHPSFLKALILCDTRAIADTAEGREGRLKTADKVEAEGTAFLATDMLPKLYSPKTHAERPELIQSARAIIESNPKAGVAAAARGMADRPDVTSWLPEIRVPALLITGEDDAISTPSEMAGIAAALPDAEHVVIQHAGHMAPQEQPETTNAAIERFLQRL